MHVGRGGGIVTELWLNWNGQITSQAAQANFFFFSFFLCFFFSFFLGGEGGGTLDDYKDLSKIICPRLLSLPFG